MSTRLERQQVPATVGRRIAACREARNWTQKKLADEAGLSVPFLSDVENDKRSIGSDGLLRLADALGASLDYLLKGTVDNSTARNPLVIPHALAQAAEEHGWSVGEAQDLMKTHQIVVARRSRTQTPLRHEELSREGWVDLYRRLFGGEKTGS